MNIDKLIAEVAEGCGLNTYFFARVNEANLRLQDIQNYPILWRQFNEEIRYTKFENEREVRTTFHFLDQLPQRNPDTETEVMPIIRRMDQACHMFLLCMKKHGVKIDMQGITVIPTVEYARTLNLPLAGVRCNLTFTYRTCK